MLKRYKFPLLLVLLSACAALLSMTPVAQSQTAVGTIGKTQLGLAFVNSAEALSGTARIQRAVAAGARLDRFPLYWSNIETSPGQFTWSKQDAALRANEQQGLGTLAILLGVPGHAYSSALTAEASNVVEMPPVGGGPLRFSEDEVAMQSICTGPRPPQGLYEPIFRDGSDNPGSGKAVNPGNPWATFVAKAVERYRPGGTAGTNVRHWEIWNEQDLCQFWQGTPEEYVRLLKVAYLVIKQYDPSATVLWGGLAHFAQEDFLSRMVTAIKSDSMAKAHNGFFDAPASHNYSIVTQGYTYVQRIRDALRGTGWENKPVWVTESGIPVCDDYPGPACPSPYRANAEAQASYVWQNIFYSRLAGAGPIFHFQLHDDCGNVNSPNSPDGFGLRKNENTSYCSPANAEARLSYSAFQVAAKYLSDTELQWSDVQDNKVRQASFYHAGSQERRIMLWATTGESAVARVRAEGTSARLVNLDGSEQVIYPTNGEYRVSLPGSHNPLDSRGGVVNGTYIGGRPYLLIEKSIPPKLVTVSGQVLNMQGKPAPYTLVTIGPSKTFADAQGRFVLTTWSGYMDISVGNVVVSQARWIEANTSNVLLVLPPLNNPVANWDFQRGLDGSWEPAGSNAAGIGVEPLSAGAANMVLRLADPTDAFRGDVPGENGAGSGGNSTIIQKQVEVRGNTPYLSLVYKVEGSGSRSSCSTNPSVYHDKFEIVIYDEAGKRYDVYCQQGASDWRYLFLPLPGELAGQKVLLHINVYESSANQRTSALVDLVAIGESPIFAEPNRSYMPVIGR